jgi:hypothetical protein
MAESMLSGLGCEKAEREAGVSHHTSRNSLRNEFADIGVLAEPAWILECNRPFFVRLRRPPVGCR